MSRSKQAARRQKKKQSKRKQEILKVDKQERPGMSWSEFSKSDHAVAAGKKCPLCWHGYGGVGKMVTHWNKGNNKHATMQCDQCGHQWRIVLAPSAFRVDGVDYAFDRLIEMFHVWETPGRTHGQAKTGKLKAEGTLIAGSPGDAA